MELKKLIKDSIGGKDYERFNLKGDPFYKTIKRPMDSFVGRDDEMRQTARSLAGMAKGNCDYIAILGNHGSGKTHFLYVFKKLVEDEDILKSLGYDKTMLIDGVSTFRDVFCPEKRVSDEGEIISKDPDMFKERRRILFFVDDLDVIASNYPKEASRVFEIFDGRIVGTCNNNFWSRVKRVAKIPSPEIVYMKPLPPKESEQLLTLRLKMASINQSSPLFPPEVISLMAKYFGGNPTRLLTYAKRYLDHLMGKNQTPSIDNYHEFLKVAGIRTAEDTIKEIQSLTPREREILLHIASVPETTTEELAEKLSITKVGAFKHLQSLHEKDLLERKQKGRSFVYYVPPGTVSTIQLEEE